MKKIYFVVGIAFLLIGILLYQSVLGQAIEIEEFIGWKWQRGTYSHDLRVN